MQQQSAGNLSKLSLKVGQSFTSYQDVENFIQAVEKSEFVQFYKRDSKTLKSMNKACPVKSEKANKSLVYYRLVYSCSKGGKTFKSLSKGKRKCSTLKEDCPMNIIFTLSEDCQKLVLSKVNNSHNHNKDEDTFRMLPKQRKLNSEQKTEVLKLKSLKCNKVLLKEYIRDKTGKNVILKDISNIKGKCGESDLQKVFDLLSADQNSVVQIVTNDSNELQGIYFQSKAMKDNFDNFPELLLLDATYKLNKFRMPLYILMVIDGCGQGQVAATFVLEQETGSNISNMIKIFKSENSAWRSVSVIMTDKDFCERRVLRLEFPNAALLLCIFHVLKSFRTNVTTTAMGINANQREVVLNILQKMVYSKNESEYEKHYKSLTDLKFPLVTKYYDKNWHSCRSEWVRCFTCKFPTFGVYTNNHLESFNQKIKGVCTKLANLQDFYEDFLYLLTSLHSERKLSAMQMWYKRPAALNLDSTEKKYFKLVTPFAFTRLQNNYRKSKTIEAKEDNTGNLIFKINVRVTETKCDCIYYTEMTLPCAHIFKFRMFKNIDLYCESLIPNRFLKETYIKNYVGQEGTIPHINTGNDNEVEVHSNVCIKTVTQNEPIKTQHQKFKKAMIKCQQLATIMSEMGQKDFNHHFDQLEELIHFWNSRQAIKFIVDKERNKEDHFNNVNEFNNQCLLNEAHCEEENDDIATETSTVNQAVNKGNNFVYSDKLNVSFNNIYCDNITSACNNTILCNDRVPETDTAIPDKTENDNNVNIKIISQVIWKTNEHEINEDTSTVSRFENDDNANFLPTIKKVTEEEMDGETSTANSSENVILPPTTENISSIKMPLKMKVRGRPKGITCTAVGLKRKIKGVHTVKNM